MFRQLPIKKPIVSPFKINSPSKVGGVMKASFDLQHIAKVSDQLQGLYDDFSQKLSESHDMTKKELANLISSFKTEAISLLDAQSKKLVSDYASQFNNVISKLEIKLQETQNELARVRLIQKGDKGDKGDMGLMPIAGIHFPLPNDGKNGEPGKNGESVNVEDVIKAIKEGKKLKMEHVDGLGVELLNLRNSISSSIQLAGRHYGKDTWARGGGDTVAAGSGISITKNSNGVSTITSTGGMSVLTATGTVDDSNTTFTFASTPTLVVVNGVSFRDGHGVTIVTTTATLDNPAGTGGDVYGLG